MMKNKLYLTKPRKFQMKFTGLLKRLWIIMRVCLYSQLKLRTVHVLLWLHFWWDGTDGVFWKLLNF